MPWPFWKNQSGWWLTCGARPAPGPRPEAAKGAFCNKKMHLIGIEPTHTAPEAIALSTELQMHLLYNTTLFQNLQGVPANFYIFFCESPFPSPAPGHWYLGFPRLAFPYSMACSGHRQMQAIQWVQSDPHTGLPSSRRILDRGQSLTQAPQPVHLSVVLNFPAWTNSL